MDWHKRFTQQASWTTELRRYIFRRIDLQDQPNILEVGCGTGAVLQAIAEELSTSSSSEMPIDKIPFHGIDIDYKYLTIAQQNIPGLRPLQGDAQALPYRNNEFDLVFCHFLLLWVYNPQQVLHEMFRVTRSGGWIAAIAEPDYGGRIDYPEELIGLGRLQEESLRRKGANPNLGRRLKSLFNKLRLQYFENGVLGAQWRDNVARDEIAIEWSVIKDDLQGDISEDELEYYRIAELRAWENGNRILYVPTFYAYGMKK